MVDHTFLFIGTVKKMGNIQELIAGGVLRELYYYDSNRVNFGLFHHDANVLLALVPHDLSIIYHLVTAKPDAVVA